MKKIGLLIFTVMISVAAFSQYDTTPPYLKTKLLPNFNLLSLDSVAFNQSVLLSGKNAGKKTLVMLFSPTCEHCQNQLKTLLGIDSLMQTTQILLTASSTTLPQLKRFYKKFSLEKYPNIFIGKDYKYFFGGFFQPKTVPVLALYNSNNQLIYFNQGAISKEEILIALKK